MFFYFGVCKIFRDFTPKIISPPEVIVFLPFQFDCLFLFLFSHLIALARISVVKKCVVKVDILCMSQRKAFSLLPLSIIFAVGFSYMTFLCVRFPSIPGMFFYHECALNFIRCLFCINWDDHVGFFPSFWYCCVLHWLTYVCSIIFAFLESSGILASQLEMVYNKSFHMLLNSVC